MAHGIFQDRRMFFSGARESIWHRIGEMFAANATWAEIQHVFYTVLERPVFAQGLTSGALPDVKALVASDDGRYLATVGKDYGVVQFEAMAHAVQSAAQGVGAVFNTGGLLGERGQKGWLLGELPGKPVTIKGGDVIRKWVLAYSGHDGRTPTTVASVAERVVCKNTLSIAMGEKGGFRVSIRHTSNAEHYVRGAGAALGEVVKSYARLEAWGNAAASHRMTTDAVEAALEAAHPMPAANDSERADTRRERIASIHTKILDLYENHEVRETAGTAWALFNAMQGFAEHFAPSKTKFLPDVTESAKAAAIAERSLFGAGADGSAEALAAVLKVTGLPHPAAMAV